MTKSLCDTPGPTVFSIAAQAAFNPDRLAKTLVSTLNLTTSPKRVLLHSPAALPLAIALHRAAPSASLTVAAATSAEAADLKPALLSADCARVAVRECALEGLEAAFGRDAFDAVLLASDPFGARDLAGKDGVPPAKGVVADACSTVAAAMRGAIAVLAPQGRLYVDCATSGEEQQENKMKTTTMARASATVIYPSDGKEKSTDTEWETVSDEAACTRRVTVRVAVNDKKKKNKENGRPNGEKDEEKSLLAAEKTGLLTTPELLRTAAAHAGFTAFDGMSTAETAVDPKRNNAAPDVLSGFVARFAADAAYYDRALAWYAAVWNESGAINWGLTRKGYPSPAGGALTKDVLALIDDKSRIGVVNGPNRAFAVWARAKAADALAAQGIEAVKGVVDVGCGTGRSTIELAELYKGSATHALGVDPGHENIVKANGFLAKEKGRVGGVDVSFFEGTMEQAVESGGESRTFELAWSEGALGHAPEVGRKATLRAVADRLCDGGVFMLQDYINGPRDSGPHTRAHMEERLGIGEYWRVGQYVEELRLAGFAVMEYVDLTGHQAECYRMLSAEARRQAGETVDGEDEEEGRAKRFTLEALSTSYAWSARAGERGETGWGLLLCRKV